MITILAQFLCIMNGGKLVQDVNNHALYGTHSITDGDMTYEITSTHHQMQYPFNLDRKDYDVLFYTNRANYYDGDGINPEIIPFDVEICLYHKKDLPKCLAIQGHPEYMRANSPIVEKINNIIYKLLNE